MEKNGKEQVRFKIHVCVCPVDGSVHTGDVKNIFISEEIIFEHFSVSMDDIQEMLKLTQNYHLN